MLIIQFFAKGLFEPFQHSLTNLTRNDNEENIT